MFAIFAALSVWQIWSSQLPPLTLPSRVPPRPNAFDTLRLAHKKLVEKVGTADIKGTRVAPPGSKVVRQSWGTLADRKALVEGNAETFELIRTALTQKYLAPIDFRLDQVFDHHIDFRDLCRALDAAARLAFENRQWKLGADYCCDAIQLGQLITTNDYIMTRLVGFACEISSISLLSDYAADLDPAAIDATYQRLEQIEDSRESIETAFDNDHIRHQLLIRTLAKQTPGEISRTAWVEDKEAWMIMFTSKRSASAAAAEFNERVKSVVRKPYDKSTAHVPIPSDPISQAALAETSYVLFCEARNRAERMLLRAYLWLRRHGPGSDLPSEFIDPFGKGAPLKIKRAGLAFTVYSVGPDGVDDGGAIINDGFGKVGRIRDTSTGDLSMTGKSPKGKPTP